MDNETVEPGSPMVGRHCVVRCYSAGVHIGTVKSRAGDVVVLEGARRLWRWEGAFTLSEVATTGISAKKSRMAVELPLVELTGAIELIPTTPAARETFDACRE